MEPVLELATRITSQIWLLHDLYPGEASIDTILSKNWRADLERGAANDYARLQALLDLTGLVSERDWDDENPLQRFRLAEEQSESLQWNLLRVYRSKVENRRLRLTRAAEIRVAAAQAALEIMQRRATAVQAQGLGETVDLIPGRRHPGELNSGSLPKSLLSPTLLTREELFEKIANWLFIASRERVRSLAGYFLGDERFLLEDEIETRVTNLKGVLSRDSPQRGLAEGWMQRTRPEKMDLLLNREELRLFCHDIGVPIPFSMVFSDELDEIARSRLVRIHGLDPQGKRLDEVRSTAGVDLTAQLPSQQAFDSGLFGLALSGGGIRSATFGLGLLQGMADRNILPYVDVLSTVSGGGYIGSWLISWIKRRGGVDAVQQSMRGSASFLKLDKRRLPIRPVNGKTAMSDSLGLVTRNTDPRADHVRPIRLLREYSRYLAPQAGLFSADFWTIAATWLRNTFLNLVVLLLFFGATLLIPRLAIFALLHLRAFVDPNSGEASIFWTLLIASLPILVGCWLIGARNLATFGPYRWRANQVGRGENDFQVVSQIVLCILAGAFLETAVLWNLGGIANIKTLPRTAALAFGVVLTLGLVILRGYTKSWNRRPGTWLPIGQRVLAKFVQPVAFLGSIATGSLLMYWLCSVFDTFATNTERGLWIAGSLGLAMMMGVIGSVVLVFLGLVGRDLSDEQREWWSRLGAWFGIAVGIWLIACAICFFMPLWIALLGLKIAVAGVGWVAITSAGVKLAFSPRSGRNSGELGHNWFKKAVMNLAPAVFILGLLSTVSFALYWGIQKFLTAFSMADDPMAHQLCCTNLPITFQRIVDNYWPLMYPGSLAPLVLVVALSVLCVIVAWRLDINEFSMHHFYKNRLVRAYLGASRARQHRLPNAFTGFDLEDDIRLHRFQYADSTQARDMAMDCKASYAGPFPIINTALNITRGADLGIQERKAESFIFTPLWSGFDFSRRQIAVKRTCLSEYAFQRTDQFGEPEDGGSLLGTAMAISGAAFNSNAGFHTSPALAFLLTVFGVRLGWWAGNPRGVKWAAPSPGLGLLYLVKELTASTGTDEAFVLLSDGGHFENMGLYELIRRRCRYVVLSDAEEDEKFKLEGIGGAIRKCRNDFGVVIDLNVDALQPLGDPAFSRLHYSLGTIVYPGEAECGKLVYIKSSMTGDEPLDIIEFRKRHAEFPHTSTTNQFFDESHFESYRALGHHVASGVFNHDMAELPLPEGAFVRERLQDLFDKIEEDWQTRLNASLEHSNEALRSAISLDETNEESNP